MIEIPKIAKVNDDGNLKSASKQQNTQKGKQLAGYVFLFLSFCSPVHE